MKLQFIIVVDAISLQDLSEIYESEILLYLSWKMLLDYLSKLKYNVKENKNIN